MPITTLKKDGKTFGLSQFVKITTWDGKSLEGIIETIGSDSMSISPEKWVLLKEIKFIRSAC